MASTGLVELATHAYSRQSMHIVNGITNPNPNKYEPGHNKAKAILSPVVDSTTPTTKKGKSEGNKGMKSLHWAIRPPGLTIYQQKHAKSIRRMARSYQKGLWEEILEGLDSVQKDMVLFLGTPSKALLLSVRFWCCDFNAWHDGTLSSTLDSMMRWLLVWLQKKVESAFAYDCTGIQNNSYFWLLKQFLILGTAQGAKQAPEHQSDNRFKGTAVNIQCMVFGNMGNTSGTVFYSPGIPALVKGSFMASF
ncbi:hypothetical protein GBA52_003885 [Prunus armeniaca]|nr:hypothetical protein GBA52_003885 [Prunus armeniaca]